MENNDTAHKTYAQSNRLSKIFRPIILVITVLLLSTQSAVIALAVSPVQNNPLSVSTRAELSRRSTALDADKAAIQAIGNNSTATGLIVAIDAVQATINTRIQSLDNAANAEQLVTIASSVDSDFPAFRTADLAAKLYTDLKAQDTSIKELRNLAQEIQDTVNAAKANGADHIVAGVAGFVLLDLINENVDKLKKSLTATTIVNVALASTMSLLADNNGLATGASSSTFSQLTDRLTGVQATLTSVSIGLSQLTNLISGNRTGISYCGFWSNCNGLENNSILQACGLMSSCNGQKNVGAAQGCGVFSYCNGQTNNGGSQYCGLFAQCAGNTNNGLSQTCGVWSWCYSSTNNGLFVHCGLFSYCSGSTNNSLSFVCGSGWTYCTGNKNNSVTTSCGYLSNCTGSTNTGVTESCGTVSVCDYNKNVGVAIACGTLSSCNGNTNSGGVISCGNASSCIGNTNNGLLVICGVLSNCQGSKTNAFVSMCGDGSACNGGTTSAFITICGSLSNCSSVSRECVVPAVKTSAGPSYSAPRLPSLTFQATAI